jgi:hypothetical protein
VWLKNFAAAALAESLGGIALNLAIDGDACRSTAIRVPTGTVENPRFASIEFDEPAEKVPWEERGVKDVRTWLSFAARVKRATASVLPERMLDDWWSTALERREDTGRIGASLAQARHLAELEWGQQNLELPHSAMCRTESFRRFACELLGQLPRFVDAYNSVLGEYRRFHGIRNHAQPVPNLARRDSWVQAPFWVWSTADPRRRAVYVRTEAAGLLISDLQSFERRLPLRDGDWQPAVAELGQWEQAGLKLRSRALVTTMFARLAAADLFIHGIGGAKYDEVTDAISERFFGAAPPAFATVSGTLRLPIAHPPASDAEVRRLRQSLRELDYHPEQFVAWNSLPTDHDRAKDLCVEKRRWVKTAKTAQNAAERHQAIVLANRQLQPFVANRRAEFETQLASLSAQSRANRILESREYAFCLFPPNLLKQFLLDFPR